MQPHPKLESFFQVPPLASAAGAWLTAFAFAAFAAGCGGAAGASSERYPENRPEPARSASDGDVLGAHEQSPEDTLDASLTNLHPAAKPPSAEAPAGEALPPHEAAPAEAAPTAPMGTEEDCVKPGERAAAAASDGARRVKPNCPPNTQAVPSSGDRK